MPETDDATEAVPLPPDGLDVAQTEAWASGLMAQGTPPVGQLARSNDSRAYGVLLALAELVDPGGVAEITDALDGLAGAGVTPPVWAFAVGSAVPLDARGYGDGAAAVAVRFEHADESRHTMLIECDEGSVTGIRFTDGDLFELVGDEAAPVELTLDQVRDRVAGSIETPIEADPETALNLALARSRLATLGIPGELRLVPEPDRRAAAEADPDGAAAALDLLRSAFGPPIERPAASPVMVERVRLSIRPATVIDRSRAEAEALGALEWADWLGAVLGVVRAGPGTLVTPRSLVDHINRCPEITTTVPARDADRVAGCFALAVDDWEDVGVTIDGRLSEAGAAALPAALDEIARAEIAGEGSN